jgi:methylenetetrahydrofolate dehydrogenase (NADP+)/methenyltetrahydrofolate cyclohydrolase
LLLNKKGIDATVTSLHSGSTDIAQSIKRADIVVAALGVPHFVKAEWIKGGAAVLDVGVTRVENSAGAALIGDIDPAVGEVAGYLSPNPGGVGPMTRAMLVKNVVKAASRI